MRHILLGLSLLWLVAGGFSLAEGAISRPQAPSDPGFEFLLPRDFGARSADPIQLASCGRHHHAHHHYGHPKWHYYHSPYSYRPYPVYYYRPYYGGYGGYGYGGYGYGGYGYGGHGGCHRSFGVWIGY
jgi:hypothetical protein